MSFRLSKEHINPDEILLNDVIKDFPPQGLYFISCERERFDSTHRKVMKIGNNRNETIEIRFLLDGSAAGHRKAIKVELMNHPKICLRTS